MPNRGPVPCAHPGCPRVVPYGQRYCSEHVAMHRGDRKSSGKRGYGSKWQKARARFLARPENIFCVECKKEGLLVRATVVDHIVPHKIRAKNIRNTDYTKMVSGQVVLEKEYTKRVTGAVESLNHGSVATFDLGLSEFEEIETLEVHNG